MYARIIATLALIVLLTPVGGLAQDLPFDRYMGQSKAALTAAFGEPDAVAKNWDVVTILTYNHQKFDGRDYTVAYSLDNDRVFSVHCADNQRASAPAATPPPEWNFIAGLGKTKSEIIAALGAPQQFSWTRPASHDNFAEEVLLYDRIIINGQPLSLRLAMDNGRVYGLQYETDKLVRLADNAAWVKGQIEMTEDLLNDPAWLRFETESAFGAAHQSSRGESWWSEGYLADDRVVCWHTASLEGGLNFQLNVWDLSVHGPKMEQEKTVLRQLMQEAWHKEDWERGGELSRFAPLFEMTE